MAKPNLLVVDDEIDSVDALERLFRKKFQVFKATSGKEALQIVKDHPLSIIISDQRMPKMTGVEFLKKSLELQPDAIRILLTGYTDVESVIESINSGEIYKYATKPWDPIDLTNTVDKAYEKFYLRQELKEKNESLQQALEELKTLDASKTQFMILINHELKTPLTVMSSFLELLMETSLDEEQQLYLKKIKQSKDQFQYITERVLSLISAQTEQEKVKKEKVLLKEIIDEAVKQVDEELHKKELDVKVDITLKSFKTDRKKLATIIHELTKNAVTFSKNKTAVLLKASEKDEALLFEISN
ncbi:MAG: hybrid sensor histidine kinase/response regulator, partial [Bdellovibrionales bacterium]|nr:hybrid sensor histidine kinase/response regulator [Bdellovibrionales bacterium]